MGILGCLFQATHCQMGSRIKDVFVCVLLAYQIVDEAQAKATLLLFIINYVLLVWLKSRVVVVTE